MLQSGLVPSVGEAYRLLTMGQISACINGSVHSEKVSVNTSMDTSMWIYNMGKERRISSKDIIDKGVILYKGTIPLQIEFRKADSFETYVKQLEPFKKYLKGEMGCRSEYGGYSYSLEIYNEAIRQIRANG